MKIFSWQALLGIFLIFLCVVLYILHYFIFRDTHHIFIYFLGDLAFLPLEVLLVSIIVHQALTSREKQNRIEKLNMVIGIFFSEVGTQLLTILSDLDPKLDQIKKELVVGHGWDDNEFARVRKMLLLHSSQLDIKCLDILALKEFLNSKKDFLVNLFENPAVLEHEIFTNLLWAVFHLTEELQARKDCSALPQTDYDHLTNDLHRVYFQLIRQWLDYMNHLKSNYPYLFSLAMRTNPFDQKASPVVS